MGHSEWLHEFDSISERIVYIDDSVVALQRFVRVEVVQFHESYSYERKIDFDSKPELSGGSVTERECLFFGNQKQRRSPSRDLGSIRKCFLCTKRSRASLQGRL